MRVDSNHGGAVSPQHISEVVARYRASGESLARFARKHGIPHGRLHYWTYGRKRTKVVARAIDCASSPPLFAEVKVGALQPPSSTWAAEVSLPRGLAVRFGPATTPSWMAEVIDALQRPC
jgi:hypothetical protein